MHRKEIVKGQLRTDLLCLPLERKRNQRLFSGNSGGGSFSGFFLSVFPGRAVQLCIPDCLQGAKLLFVTIFTKGIEDSADSSPSEDQTPLHGCQRGAGSRNHIHDTHHAGHSDGHKPDKFIMLYSIGSFHIRLFFPENHKGNGHHAVSQTAGEVSGVHNPDQHFTSEEGGKHAQNTDQQKGCNRGLVLFAQRAKHRRDHVGLGHRIHGPASSDQEGVPAGDDSAKSSDNQYLCHDRAVEGHRHGVCRNQSVPAVGRGNGLRIHHITYSKNNQNIKADCQNNRQKQHFRYFFQRDINLLRRLRNNIKPDKEEGAHHGDLDNIAECLAAGISDKLLSGQVGRASAE